MVKEKIFHHAFRVKYDRVVKDITEVKVGLPSVLPSGGPPSFIKFLAIWDTGATNTVITPLVVNKLNLKPTGQTEVYGVNSKDIKNTYIVDIALPVNVAFSNVNVTECDINSKNANVLIGMDIIQTGDFAIANANNKTTFSFCIPPHKNPIDLLEKSNRVNPKSKKKIRIAD